MSKPNKLAGFVQDARLHWKTPAYGNYVPIKDILGYGIGGMGVKFALALVGTIALSTGNALVGSTIGIAPTDLQVLQVISTILGFAITSLRAYILDNTNTKYGKFRPYLLYMGIPTVAISILFVYLPYDNMLYWQKMVAVLLCYNAIQLFSPFYEYSYTNILQVISPNTQERTNIISVTNIILSLAPSITGLIVPALAAYTGGLDSIQTYRYVYPPFCVFGLIIGYFAFYYSKERIVQAKSHINDVRFFDAIVKVAKNKYFWIKNCAGWIGFLEGAAGVIIQWTYMYGRPKEDLAQYGLVTTIIGNSALFAMMLAPFVIKKIGKRNLLILCNLMNIVLLLLLLPFYKNIVLLVVLSYCNGFFNAFANIYNPSIDADMKDYQQYISGERIDGMFSTVGLIGGVIGMGTGFVVPAIYERMGLHEDYSVLYDAAVREPLIEVLIIASVIGAFLNVIPYFFYDLTEQKHGDIIKVLKIRALFEDYANGDITDDALADTVEMIHHSIALAEEPLLPEGKELTVPKGASYSERKEIHKKRRLNKQHNAQINSAKIVLNEMNKFASAEMMQEVELAKAICDAGVKGITDGRTIEAIESFISKNPHMHRKGAKLIRLCRKCAKKAKRYYNGGEIIPFNREKLVAADAMPETTAAEKRARKAAVHKAIREKSHYERAAMVYLDAYRLVKQCEDYKNYDEIAGQYSAARERADEKKRREMEEVKRLEEIRRAELESYKNNKKSGKSLK